MTHERGATILTLIAIRCLDVLFAAVALIALSPLLILIATALRLSGEGEVLYRQNRIGRGGREFQLLKFATMLKNSPATGSGELTLPDDPRVLPLGRILRKTKLNELPQLINVLTGDLSLIGPRPQTRRYYDCYLMADRVWIATIRPGLSGVGSILFRNEEALLSQVNDPVAFDEKTVTPYKGQVEHWFAVNQSISLYFELIFSTVIIVLIPKANIRQRLLRRLPSPPSELSKLLQS